MNAGAMRNSESETDAGLDYQDTVGLLQEEIARLEEELRMRIEAAEAQSAAVSEASPPENSATEARNRELTAELACRDETIDLLWEQVLRFEEAEAAARAEWDQLHEWVVELENRVENQSTAPEALQEALEEHQRRAEALRLELSLERKAWDAHRRRLEAEVAELKGRASGIDHEHSALEPDHVALAKAEAFREQLEAAQQALEAAHQELQAVRDEQQRERKEHEAELAAQRRLRARETLPAEKQAPGPIPVEGQGQEQAQNLSPDQRIRALREHLREIHRREEEERKNRQLSSRLSRLWRRTGPTGPSASSGGR